MFVNYAHTYSMKHVRQLCTYVQYIMFVNYAHTYSMKHVRQLCTYIQYEACSSTTHIRTVYHVRQLRTYVHKYAQYIQLLFILFGQCCTDNGLSISGIRLPAATRSYQDSTKHFTHLVMIMAIFQCTRKKMLASTNSENKIK